MAGTLAKSHKTERGEDLRIGWCYADSEKKDDGDSHGEERLH